jgi:hypothetical protein
MMELRTIDKAQILDVSDNYIEVAFDPQKALETFPTIQELRFGQLRLSRHNAPKHGCEIGAVGYLRRAETRMGAAWVLVLGNGRH